MEEARHRCVFLRDRALEALPSSKISSSAKLTLNRLISAELRFLSSSSHPNIISLNIGYLQSILRAIQHPSVRHVSRLCKPVAGVHVDVVCTFARFPAWFFVSDRNPTYILWSRSKSRSSLKSRIVQILTAARSTVALKPALIFLLFSKGVSDDVARKLADEFAAAEIEFVGFGRAFEIKIESGLDREDGQVEALCRLDRGEENGFGNDGGFGSLISSMRPDDDETAELVNFDTTALVALVSGISNGGCERLLKAPEVEMRARLRATMSL